MVSQKGSGMASGNIPKRFQIGSGMVLTTVAATKLKGTEPNQIVGHDLLPASAADVQCARDSGTTFKSNDEKKGVNKTYNTTSALF